MKMDGEYTLPTNVENVWNNLNDPLVLKNSIPGCTELIKENDNEFCRNRSNFKCDCGFKFIIIFFY